MSDQIQYHFVSAASVEYSIVLTVHDFPKITGFLEAASEAGLRDFLVNLIQTSDLRFVRTTQVPVEVTP